MIPENDPALRLLMGEEITEAERKQLNEEHVKRTLIKFLFAEKMKEMGHEVRQSNFTFGPNWMQTPTIDIVNSLIDIQRKVDSGEIKPLTPEQLAQM